MDSAQESSGDELLLKLVVKRCLPGPERRRLIELGGISVSNLKRVIKLAWVDRIFPVAPGGCSLEKLENGMYRLNETYETGICTRAHRTKDFSTIDAAIAEYIDCEFGTNIDGIEIK